MPRNRIGWLVVTVFGVTGLGLVTTGLAPDGRFCTVPGAHSFVWTTPDAWSAPIEDLARRLE